MIQSGNLFTELPYAECFILMLAALFARGDDETRWQVFEPDGAFRLVDMLAAWPARPEGVYLAFPQQIFVRFRQ